MDTKHEKELDQLLATKWSSTKSSEMSSKLARTAQLLGRLRDTHLQYPEEWRALDQAVRDTETLSGITPSSNERVSHITKLTLHAGRVAEIKASAMQSRGSASGAEAHAYEDPTGQSLQRARSRGFEDAWAKRLGTTDFYAGGPSDGSGDGLAPSTSRGRRF